ncbi:MAG TPA: cysteine desulfurase [Actinomycetota bacterium]|nr:cysteine desulfurase [Actinomycetota bacterium]
MARPAEERDAVDVETIRRDFPILSREMSGRPLVYLDSASTSQKPRAVIDAVVDFYERHNANAHRGIYPLGQEATDAYEGARERVAAFIGAPDPRCVVFNRGTTESINLVAHGWGRRFLEEGDEILLTEIEHHSNIVPWQLAAQATGAQLRYVPLNHDGLIELDDVASLITSRTKLVAITGQSNVLGTFTPIHDIAEMAHEAGARLLVDGAQFVSHNPVDVVELDVDFLTISGHKMLGPTASGGLYGRRELLEEMDPFLGGGEMILEVFDDHSTYKEPPWKFEAGTMNVAQSVGLAAAVEYLDAIGMKMVRDHERELTGYAIDRLAEAGARVFGSTDPDRRGGAISFWYKDIHPHDLATVLGERGVAVRAGHHCAQPLMRRLGVPATARASFHVYSTRDEVDALVDALRTAEEVFG